MISDARDDALDAFFSGRTLDEMEARGGPDFDRYEATPRIQVMDEDGNRGAFTVRGFVAAPNLRVPFVAYLAMRAEDFLAGSIVTEEALLRYFARFLDELGLSELRLRQLDDALLDRFRDWLNEQRTAVPDPDKIKPRSIHARRGGDLLAVGTKIAVMDKLLDALRWLAVEPEFADQVRSDVDLRRGADWRASGRHRPTVILTRPQLKALVRVCREEVTAITSLLESAWTVFDNKGRVESAEVADAALLREAYRLQRVFNGKPPATRNDFRTNARFDKRSFPRIWACNGPDYQKVLALHSPSGRLLMPFLLLFAVYYRYNPAILTGLKRTDLTEQDSLNGTRIAGAPFKNRSGRVQHASWPAGDAAHNPKKMLETLDRWTSGIRSAAPAGAEDAVFLARYSGGKVRTLDSGQALANALDTFLVDAEERIGARFNLKQLRPSVINLVYHLFDGDVIAAMHAGHHRKADTTIEHYLSDGARKQNDEALSGGVHRLVAWALSGGRVDPREDKRGRADYAATPGWTCADPFGSPVPESWGVGALAARRSKVTPCTAYGMCDFCQLGAPRLDSSDAYSLALKLRDAIRRARTTMPEAAWLGRWAPVLDKLERKTIESFSEAAKAAVDLTIPDLPTVE